MNWWSLIKTKSVLLFTLSLVNMHGQFKDAGLWSEIALSAEYHKWTFQCAPEVRMHENITRVGRAFVDVGAQYKWSKSFFLTTTYRIGVGDEIDYYDLRQRIQGGFGMKKKYGDFTFTLLSRMQMALQGKFAETDADFMSTWRNRIQAKYALTKKWGFSSSYEFFHGVHRYQPMDFQNWRWMATLERDLPNKQSVRFGYLIQKKRNSSPQELDFVFLVSYDLQINFERKEKQEIRFIGTPSF
ncbi:MAG: DUF2490 domain-containing protein [Flavobacteriales bacterium]